MVKATDPEPQYKAPAGGAYSVEEHLRAQTEQTYPEGTSKAGQPLHEPTEDAGAHAAPGDGAK